MILPTLAQAVVLTGATVHTMVPGEEPAVRDVWVEDGRFRAVGPDLEVPAEVEVVDVTGLHLLPGLIDAKVNHDADHDLLYVAAGITLVRDIGNDLARILQERLPLNRDRVPGPAIVCAGLSVDGPSPGTTSALVLDGSDNDAEKLARYMAQVQPDFFSISGGLSEAAWRSLLEAAAESQLQVWGPVPAALSLQQALSGGQYGLFSLQWLLPPGRGWYEVEDAELEPGLERLAASDVKVVPFVGAFARMEAAQRDDAWRDERLALLGPHYRAGWSAELAQWLQLGEELAPLTARTRGRLHHCLRRMREDGVHLVPGSGSPHPWLPPGEALIAELSEWVAAGFDTGEVLDLATRGAAEALGLGDERGRIAPGLVADAVLYGLDPRDGLSVLREPELVVLRGRVLERDELLDKLDALLEVQAEREELLASAIELDAPETPEGRLLLDARCETVASGVRISSERMTVVDTPNGRRIFATRVRTPEAATLGSSELHLVQQYEGKRLVQFQLTVSAAGQEYVVAGQEIGALMNVEVRSGAQVLYRNRAREPIRLVDVGSGLTALLAGQIIEPGENYVLAFEDLDPIVNRWNLLIDEVDHQFVIDAGIGAMWYGYRANGAPVFGVRRQGNASTQLKMHDVLTYDAEALLLPAGRVFIPRDPAAAEAAAGSGER